MSDVATARGRFADALRAKARLRSLRLVEAFASVPRERFLGEGPWSVCEVGDDGRASYRKTATRDPAEVYRDVLIAIDASRGLNNGEPSSLASWLDALDVQPGEKVVHIGAGTGYYTAILVEIVGATGRVDAFEIDPSLAARARDNLAAYGNANVACGGDRLLACGSIDAMFVNCGVTHPAIEWLASLRDGARLLLPVTAQHERDDIGRGAMYLASRRGASSAVTFVSAVGIFPCSGQRDDALDRALLAKRGDDWRAPRSLRLDRHAQNASCWLHAAECCLSTVPPDAVQ